MLHPVGVPFKRIGPTCLQQSPRGSQDHGNSHVPKFRISEKIGYDCPVVPTSRFSQRLNKHRLLSFSASSLFASSITGDPPWGERDSFLCTCYSTKTISSHWTMGSPYDAESRMRRKLRASRVRILQSNLVATLPDSSISYTEVGCCSMYCSR